ncbi:MAG: hypothetical protein II852_13605 [Bacteroidales bacterium]|nr:hypothetical protein [Bacteroidales bacterium]
MFVNLYKRKFTVFLSAVTDDMADVRRVLGKVLDNAGIAVVDAEGGSTSGGGDGSRLELAIQSADCSIHILGNTDIYTLDSEGYDSPAGEQFRCAKAKCNELFKMFVWNPLCIDNSQYITDIRRDIVENTIYSDKQSPIVFVEDIRNIMNVRQTESRRHEPTDIFFLYNELDSDTATGIYNMLRDFLQVSRLGISMSSDMDYNTYITEQLADSKIGVVYYNYAADWAVSFARQIWKDSGGNSSHTPILVVGNSNHAKMEDLAVLQDIMQSSVNDQLRIPLDIKVFLDKQYQK